MSDHELRDVERALEDAEPVLGWSFPIEVARIEGDDEMGLQPGPFPSKKPGTFVAIRPCGESKTYLGLLLGDLPLGLSYTYDPDTKVLKVAAASHNPAIFVFDLGKTVMGCESWWGKIKDEAHLRQITDNDIDNVWYVKALKAMAARPEGPLGSPVEKPNG